MQITKRRPGWNEVKPEVKIRQGVEPRIARLARIGFQFESRGDGGPKTEAAKPEGNRHSSRVIRNSSFGIPSSFGPRISDFLRHPVEPVKSGALGRRVGQNILVADDFDWIDDIAPVRTGEAGSGFEREPGGAIRPIEDGLVAGLADVEGRGGNITVEHAVRIPVNPH